MTLTMSTIPRPTSLTIRYVGVNLMLQVRLEVLTTAIMEVIVIWDVTPSCLVEIGRRVRCGYCAIFRTQHPRIQSSSKKDMCMK
jgi:hypothetical protein